MTRKLYEYTELTKLERAFLIYVFKHTQLPIDEGNMPFVVFKGIKYDDNTGFTKNQVMGIASSLVQKGIIRTYLDDSCAWRDENGRFQEGMTENVKIYGDYVEKYICEDKYFKLKGMGAVLTQEGMEVDA